MKFLQFSALPTPWKIKIKFFTIVKADKIVKLFYFSQQLIFFQLNNDHNQRPK